MELLERLFSLWETAGRVGEKEGTGPQPVCPWMGPQNPHKPVLAVAAVLAVALGRAVALQQAALSIVRVLHCILLPILPMVVFYHTAKGGRAGFIWGSSFSVSHLRGSSPNAATGAGGHSFHSIPLAMS